MLLRKLVAAFCPLLLCLVLCLLYRWLDGILAAGLFWSFLLKGLLLGVALALIIPLAGLRCHSNGLQPWRADHLSGIGTLRLLDDLQRRQQRLPLRGASDLGQ